LCNTACGSRGKQSVKKTFCFQSRVRFFSQCSWLFFPWYQRARSSISAAAADGFTDISKESGITDIVAQQYKVMDKVLADRKYNPNQWWLSGLTLADLDNNGTLDLHMAGQPAVDDDSGRQTQVLDRWVTFPVWIVPWSCRTQRPRTSCIANQAGSGARLR
jgi:hypothetical protein